MTAAEIRTLARTIERGRRILDAIRDRDDNFGRRDVQDLFINDPERGARVWDAAEHGAEGSTHAEYLSDQREAWHSLTFGRDLPRVDRAVTAFLDSIEAWHAAAGTLHEEIG